MFLVRLLEKQIVIQAISLDIIKKNDHDQIELTEYSRTDAFERNSTNLHSNEFKDLRAIQSY